MARPTNEKLNYFSLNVDFFDDPKILLIEEQFGIKGGYIAVRLLCFIYSQGYYIEWSDDMALVFAKRVACSHALVNEVVGILLKRRFLNEGLFERYKILTSAGIQRRWLKVIHDAKRKSSINSAYNLINSEVIAGETELTTADKEETTHSIVQYSIENERAEEQPPAPVYNLTNSHLYSKPNIPTFEKVHEVFVRAGGTKEMAQKFFDTYSAVEWINRQGAIKNFANLVPSFITNWKKNESKNGGAAITSSNETERLKAAREKFYGAK